MDYFTTKKEALNACPDARWVYVDRRGAGGSDRWFASRRLLKEAKKKLVSQNQKPADIRDKKNYPIQIELF